MLWTNFFCRSNSHISWLLTWGTSDAQQNFRQGAGSSMAAASFNRPVICLKVQSFPRKNGHHPLTGVIFCIYKIYVCLCAWCTHIHIHIHTHVHIHIHVHLLYMYMYMYQYHVPCTMHLYNAFVPCICVCICIGICIGIGICLYVCIWCPCIFCTGVSTGNNEQVHCGEPGWLRTGATEWVP
jgi:hypothetical protein